MTVNQSPGASVQTDGVALNIHYIKMVHSPSEPKTLEEQLSSLRGIGADNLSIIGLDPGRRSIFTVAGLTNDTTERFKAKSYGIAEYRHDSGSTARSEAVKRRLRASVEMSDWIANIPTKKTCDINLLEKYIRYIAPRLPKLVAYFSSKKNKSWRFTSFSKKKSTFDSKIPTAILSVLNDVDMEKTVIAFGNAHINPCSRGIEPGPTKLIKRSLRNRGFIVVDIDEYMTSQKCCVCHQQLTADGIPPRPPNSKTSNWSVRRCTNEKCRIGHGSSLDGTPRPHSALWNRDVNASYNMAVILRELLMTGTRPDAFLRTNNTTYGQCPVLQRPLRAPIS